MATINYTPYTLTIGSETTIYQNEVKCRVSENDFNYSQNPTVFANISYASGSGSLPIYASYGQVNRSGFITDGKLANNITGSDFHPYTTTIGLYNEAKELLVVGKLATPYPIPSNTDITFVLKWDS